MFKKKKNMYSWDGKNGKIVSRGYEFNIKEKVKLDFDYDFLYYEPQVNTKIKIINERSIKLTDNEIKDIESKCDKYLEVGDYEVYAYDSGTGIYEGTMLRSEAKQKRHKFRIFEKPEYPLSKWTDGRGWEKVKATVLENGTINIDPNSICPKCVLVLTEEEWNNFPERPKDFYLWDIKESKWYDPRKIEDLRKNAKIDIRNSFEILRWNLSGEFVPQFEQQTWNDQYFEASSWLKDKSYNTPYIDTFLSNRTDGYIPNKEDLCKDIVENHSKFLKSMAEVSANQWSFLKRIENANTNDEIDNIKEEALRKANELVSSLKKEDS